MPSQSSALEQIEKLQQQIEQLKQDAVTELKQKIVDARKVVADLEAELEELTGKPATSGAKATRVRRPSITDDELKQQILKVMATDGKNGMNAKQIADAVEQSPLRIRAFIKSNPKALKRQGQGAGTKFFLQ